MKYKRTPQDRYILERYPPLEVLQRGKRIVRAIGFEAGEERRSYAHVVKAIGLDAGEEHRLTWTRTKAEKGKLSRESWLDQHFFRYWYPLMEWGFDREKCKQIIANVGLPIPIKSACFFCPASKKHEIAWLEQHHPELLERALEIDRNAQAKLKTVKGLGRSYSWGRYVRQRLELPLLDCCG